MIAATFVHNKFPHRVPPDRALIRCFLGGARDDAIAQSSEAEIQDLTRREIEQILGIHSQPLFVRIHKWSGAMAQYNVGHGPRVTRIREILAKTPGLALAGNAYGGIGVPDCVRSGSEAAAKILADMGVATR